MKHVNVAAIGTVVCTGLLAGVMLTSTRAGAAGVIANLSSFENGSGQSRTFNPRGVLTPDNPFFQDLGTNGRTCATCHQASEGWSITPAGVQRRFAATDGLDPIFRTNDGSNCEGAPAGNTPARRRAFSLLLSRGLIRVAIDVPNGAEFTIESVDDPYNCGAGTTSASMYRRPLPATNLRFLSAVMWDGRESPANLSIREGLLTQAKDATLSHAQAALTPTDAELEELVDFELGLSTSQALD